MSTRKLLPFLMWIFPLFFFTYQFIFRLWPSLMMQQIMQQFAVDASGFGLLAALYYYGYSGMQIPIAIMLERFGARYVIFACATLCGAATFLFNYTDNWYLACLSRCLVGVGSAVGFLGVSKVVSEWFPKSLYARMIGFSFTVGLTGAIYGGKPISIMVESYGYQKVAAVLALISIAWGVCTYLFLKPSFKNKARALEETVEGNQFQGKQFKKLLSSPVIWFLALANLLMVGSLEGFADVWGVPYLMTGYSIAKSEAAALISFIFVGMIFGGPLLAALSQRLGNYTVISLCGVGMAIAFLGLLSLGAYNWYLLATLFFFIGILCCYQVIVFAAGSELVSISLLGVTIAFLNCINMLGGSFFHTTVGLMMDWFWTGSMGGDGLRHYTVEAYQSALLIIPASAIVGTGIVALIGYKERKSTLEIVGEKAA